MNGNGHNGNGNGNGVTKKAVTKKAKSKRTRRPKSSESASANKRSETDIARDRAEISELYLRGNSMREIAVLISAARPYSLSRNAVLQDIKAARSEWRERAILNISEHVEEQLAKIDQTEAEAWNAWERSKEDAVTVKSESGSTGTKDSETRVGQSGDASFLRVVLDCIERRSKLLGLDAPDRHEISGPNGMPLGGLEDEAFARMEREAKILN